MMGFLSDITSCVVVSVSLLYSVLEICSSSEIQFSREDLCKTGCASYRHDVEGTQENGSREASSALGDLLQYVESLDRPGTETGKPTEVRTELWIGSIDSGNVERMEYSISLILRMSWKDPRLITPEMSEHFFNNVNSTRITINHRLISRIWIPDLFFTHEKAGHAHCVTVPNQFLWLEQDGTLLYSKRYTLNVACHMDLHHFPMDKQKCQLQIESYAYTEEELLLKWKEIMPVEINENLEQTQFDLTKFLISDSCSMIYHSTGTFSCLRIVFDLHREYGHYIIQTYIPSSLIVALSWLSFWLNIDAIPARITLGALTVLTMTTQCVGVWMTLPRVPYIKAIDIWMSTCALMVFLAILEFALVSTLARKEIKKMYRNQSDKDDSSDPDLLRKMADEYNLGLLKVNHRTLARKVDKISRVLFPLSFLIFNIIYWIILLPK